MDQGFIECTKRHYRRQLLRKLLLAEENNEERVLDSYKKINLKDYCYMIADSWNMVKSVTLKRAWNRINGTSTKELLELEKQRLQQITDELADDEELEVTVAEFVKLANNIAGCSEVDVEDMEEWLQSDNADPGFQIMTDNEIAESVMDEQQSDIIDSDETEEENVPTHGEAFICFENALKWMERQPECEAVQLLAVKRLRDLAARKRATTSRQRTLLEMFK
uniref:DDE-1 domain-containing protein n=1 Tax=Homalodisca liturata TaxID=320908 RepID=A0A1B6J5S2_9HEMI